MIKKVFITLCMIFILSSCSEQQVETSTSNEDVKILEDEALLGESIIWYGRHHLEDEQVFFYYPGTGFKIMFTGSAVNINLALDNKHSDIYFSLSKDCEPLLDGDVVVLSEAEQTIQITFDTYGEHVIEFVKRSEPRDGVTSLLSLETNGTFMERPEEENVPHFLIIGASGISGNGAIGEPWQGRTTANSSCLHSFGYLTAEGFNGSYEFVSNSGWGLAFGYNDRTGEDNIMSAYESVGIDADQNIVDVSDDHSPIPDIIIVNIGGNDYSAVINRLTGFAREEKILEFKDAVADFIFTLREDAPDAHIFWTMTEGSFNGAAAQSVFDLLPADDKFYVHMVIINGVGEGGETGANNHASYESHLGSSNILIDAIEQYTDYNRTEE
ncbi:MAG: hypothetical protein PF513_04175 [Tenericutes bacterium]|jgi:hypothetical protein|nr:hypothetical protein [Mycoplasmatota bacterium]